MLNIKDITCRLKQRNDGNCDQHIFSKEVPLLSLYNGIIGDALHSFCTGKVWA